MIAFWFCIIAFIYSSVGFAGGSSYLLVLTLAGFEHSQSAPVALLCNLVVSSIGVWHFHRTGHLKWSLVLPFLAASVPMAYLGSRISIQKEIFIVLLAISLGFASLRLLLEKIDDSTVISSAARNLKYSLPVGGLIGFFSGIIGIGGGIFLSPYLILSRMASVKQASAAASLFILVNSLTGLFGKIQNGFVLTQSTYLLLPAVFIGGWLGSRLACGRLPQPLMQRVLAGLLLVISFTLLQKAL